MVSTSTALADEVGGPPPVLEPVKKEKPCPEGEVCSRQTVSPGRSYKCVQAGTLRRKHGSYVIGWCLEGVHIDISSGNIEGWQAGWTHGNFEGCGWFLTGMHTLEPSGVYDRNCGSTEYVESYFANRINAGSTTDGSSAPIYRVCNRYANVRPWVTGATSGHDSPGTLQPSTDRFYWRYVTKNNMWVMGRMTRNGAEVSRDWIFVPRDCVGEPSGGTRAASSSS